jgi:hypothetical protein
MEEEMLTTFFKLTSLRNVFEGSLPSCRHSMVLVRFLYPPLPPCRLLALGSMMDSIPSNKPFHTYLLTASMLTYLSSHDKKAIESFLFASLSHYTAGLES